MTFNPSGMKDVYVEDIQFFLDPVWHEGAGHWDYHVKDRFGEIIGHEDEPLCDDNSDVAARERIDEYGD